MCEKLTHFFKDVLNMAYIVHSSILEHFINVYMWRREEGGGREVKGEYATFSFANGHR